MAATKRPHTRAHAPRSRTTTALLFVPVVALVLMLVGSFAGVDFVERATGLSSTDGQVVTANLTDEVFLTPTCGAGALSLGTIIPGDPGVEGTDCSLSFFSNTALGADLTVHDVNNLGVGTMRCVIPSCGAATIADLGASPSAPPAAGNSFFGMRLAATGGGAVNDINVNGGAALTGDYYSIADAPGTLLCHTTAAVVTGTCDVRFAAQASGSQIAGDYEADIRFTVADR